MTKEKKQDTWKKLMKGTGDRGTYLDVRAFRHNNIVVQTAKAKIDKKLSKSNKLLIPDSDIVFT